MHNVQITLGNEDNAAEVLLNKMVATKVPVSHMVVVVSSLIHTCETGYRLDTFDRCILNECGYESFEIISTIEDYHAMKALEVYLDEELPGILATKN